jgi:hypothetical protein
LLSACSTYYKTHATSLSGQRNVYAANFTQDNYFYNAHDGYTYGVDTDVTDILACTITMQFKGMPLDNHNDKSLFIPREEGSKLSPEKGEEIVAPRRNESNARY